MTAAIQAQPLPLRTKLAYGFGSVAYGVKGGGFDYFLLLFFSQVVGLDARLVGIAVTTALIVDAISDPIVGYWSDNLRSRWGRRHPFMYAAALPVPLSYFLIWNPPDGWSQTGLFGYLLVLAIVIRTFITLYETPSSALAPELTQDYEERSKLLSFRSYFGWTGGNSMTVLVLLFIFPMMTTEAREGRFLPESYALMGIIGSCVIFLSIMISALGTHSRIPLLKAPPPKRQMTLRSVFGEIFETLSNRSFISLFVAALFGAVATGLAAGLAFYFQIYFWGFTSVEQGLINLATFIAAILGFIVAPIATRRLGKKRGAMTVGLVAFLGAPMPIVLRLLGWLPENGTDFIFWFVFITNAIDVGLIIAFQILFASMMADLVEQSELETGRRSEGLFFSAVTFIRKSVQGFGLLAASFVLVLAEFPAGATPAEVGDDALRRLGLYYVPAILFLWLSMMAVISTYKLDRAEHEENLRKLAAGASAAP